MYKDLKCPYCGHEQDVCHDDGFGYEEGVKHEDQCGKCGKYFVFETSISFYYEAEKADCLNGSAHDWKPSFTCPVEYTDMICQSCDTHRPCTDDEMKEVQKQRTKAC